jgi:hypothetical protein
MIESLDQIRYGLFSNAQGKSNYGLENAKLYLSEQFCEAFSSKMFRQEKNKQSFMQSNPSQIA